MAADTRVTWEGIGTDMYSGVKLYHTRNAIYGITGEDCSGSLLAIDWLQAGAPKDFRPTPPRDCSWTILELSEKGIALYNEHMERETTLATEMAVGSGRKVALYCMRILKMSPPEAVREACRLDAWSEVPVFVSNLKETEPKRWQPVRKKKR